MSDKLQLPSKVLDAKARLEKGSDARNYGTPVRIRKSVYDLLDNVAEESGFSKVTLVEKLVLFAIDKIEFVTTKEFLENEENTKGLE